MSDMFSSEPMLEMFQFETTQLLEQLEQIVIKSEEANSFSQSTIDEIFRIMHTIKGSSAMMLFNNISELSHTVEDLFFYLRKEKPTKVDFSQLADLVLDSVDFMKVEMGKIEQNGKSDGDSSGIIENINGFLSYLKQINVSLESSNATADAAVTTVSAQKKKQHYYISQNKNPINTKKNIYKAIVHFVDGCEMENIRAFTLINNLKEITSDIYCIPDNVIEDEQTIHVIRNEGFKIYLIAEQTYQEIHDFLIKTSFLLNLELTQLDDDAELEQLFKDKKQANIHVKEREKETQFTPTQQSMISVNVAKLDKLMDLVGELVISEAMVTQNPDLHGLNLINFRKAARQLQKITSELQDTIMSTRMVPLTSTFQKMKRIIRDMSKRLNKEVDFQVIGEDTEVDKNIIEHISDPLMHLIRNAVDHGIETLEERQAKGKVGSAKITLEAKNVGREVVVLVKDNGKGLNKASILQKASENGLLTKAKSEMNDKETYALILLPGFSTKENITEFSGRGVGMDVVSKNIDAIGGSLVVDSIPDEGTTFTMKLPLTLSIIDGMNIRVGTSRYTVPITSIKESFRTKKGDIILDPDGNEMIMVRGECYQILRLHKLFNVSSGETAIPDGIIIMVENNEHTFCIFADELLGEQQVVVKGLPKYIKKIKGLAGCTLMGDGGISLILDVAGITEMQIPIQ